jgi:ArsR family transcriptional regulator, lead/cadmium/zinc/bismuth-responsive transcriptional repressor
MKDTLRDRHKRDLAHEKKVHAIQQAMKPELVFENLSETFKALGDSTRIRIIFALSQEELCVYCIAKILNMSDSAISHQLRILRNMKLVKHRREGQMVYYRLDDDHIRCLLKDGLEHVEEE